MAIHRGGNLRRYAYDSRVYDDGNSNTKEIGDGMSTNIKPLGSRVVAVPVEPAKKTNSGLLMLNNSVDQKVLATVEAVGPQVKEIKTGDQIIYKEYATTELTLDKVIYLLVDEEDVLATLPKEDTK